ncbi:Ser/Thr protein kinase RdoA involved in Cpx stress response, MazF antagonist [Sanguibacter gelidistatuariae]|uniref:Ser/Thr protein kinase RdoA involved in Cpx stress response, MazF antagonist n=1 Tax=Sanguibacter gelidistatuariae TaxID=1814289 RepID=A0A1G6RFE0_9MICO|nr:aminoglycoside phosphotransferase family protein [Sanguibacter gelidistatuariae]SDD03278.1 Ser/Thr protein kinase RdoA involved in Cpx stress response, MazF antagonist [Sanguibacter gelidistatuariae]
MSAVGSQAGTPDYQTAQRPSWSALPPAVRSEVEARCGSAVVSAATQSAGFTPGLACRLTLADGTGVFLKGAHETTWPWVVSSYRTEAATVVALPAAVRAPALRWTAEVDGWFLAAYEDVSGRHPARPWSSADIDVVLGALTRVAGALTPVPDAFDAPDYREEFSAFAGNLDGLDPRVVPADYAREARRLADRVLRDAPATTLCHNDLRDDNLLIDATGEVRIFDWNFVSAAPAWFDLVGLVCSIAGDGGDADALVARHPLTNDVDADLIDGTLALLFGYYVTAAVQEEVATSPWLRRHQRWYRNATWSWLCSRRGWDPSGVLSLG